MKFENSNMNFSRKESTIVAINAILLRLGG